MTTYRLQSFSSTHITIDGGRYPKSEIRYKADNAGIILNVGSQQKIPNKKPDTAPVAPGNILNGDNGDTPFANAAEFDAYMFALLNGSTTTAQIAVTLNASYIENDVFIGRTVSAIIINDMTKNTGFEIVEGSEAGKINRLQFTDVPATTVTVGQQVTIIFAA